MKHNFILSVHCVGCLVSQQIRTLLDDTGSNTMKMFRMYVSKNNGGSLWTVMTTLRDLGREDAITILENNKHGKMLELFSSTPETNLCY